MKRLGLVSAAVLLLLAAASHTFAEPPAAGRKHERELLERQRDRVLEQLKQRGLPVPSGSPLPPDPSGSASVPAPSGSVPPAAPFGSAGPGAERLAELARRWRALGENRLERRERNRAALVRQLGQRLSDPQVKGELKLHATRTAELTRLRFLAENARSGAPRDKLLARITKLSARETERHQKQLAKLAAAGASASAPSGSAVVPPAPTPIPSGAKP